MGKTKHVETPLGEMPLKKEEIEYGVSTLMKVVENTKQTSKKNPLFDDKSHTIYIQIVPIKVPSTPKVDLRVSLPNPLSEGKDACLIVKNVHVNGKKNDHEKTINHYKNLLRDIGIKGSIQIVPIGQLCDEHKRFEEKGKFAQLYDTYLVDGLLLAVAGRTLGTRFSKAGHNLIPIQMNSKGLKTRIEAALAKSVLTLHPMGDTFTMKAALTSMTEGQISDNILAALTGVCKINKFPGGFNNIRSVRIKTERSLAIPIYITLKKANSVPTPVTKIKLPKAYKVEEGELSTVFGGVVRVNPEGDVHFRKVITAEDRKMLANGDSDDLADDAKEELESDSEEEEVVVKPKSKSKALKRKAAEVEESDDEDVEAAEKTYMSEWQAGLGDKESDEDEEEESADEAPVAKKQKPKKSPKSKKAKK